MTAVVRAHEYRDHFRNGLTVAQVAAVMGVSVHKAARARQRLRMPTKGVVGRRGGARGRSQIERERG